MFAAALLMHRERLGLTQAGAAKALNVARDTVAAWESERNIPLVVTQDGVLQRLKNTTSKIK